MTPRARLIVFVAAAMSIALLWLFDLPLGIPGEWTWTRIGLSDRLLLVLGAVQAACLYAVFALVAWAGSRRMAAAGRLELAGWMSGLVLTGFAWLHAVQEAPPEGQNLAKIPFVLYYPSSSGYFFQARYEVQETSEFLRDYESVVAEGDVLHAGTHPPGMIVMFRLLICVADTLPSLAALPEWVLTQSADDSFGVIRDQTAGTPQSLTGQDRTVIWLAAMLTQLAAACVVVPLFGLLRLALDRQTAWRTVCFWPLVPAVAVFLPKSDVLFAPGSCLLVCLWLYAVRAASNNMTTLPEQTGTVGNTARRNWLSGPLALGVLAGGVGWLGLFCSLVFLPVGAIAVAASALMFRRTSADAVAGRPPGNAQWLFRRYGLPCAGGAIAFAGLTVAVAFFWQLNLPRVWMLNYANHARFYEVSPRTYLGWLLVNPVELVFALGAPLVVILFIGPFRRNGKTSPVDGPVSFFQRVTRPENGAAVSVAAVWGLLWLTGKNSGEVARLWIPLMPLAVWAAASCWSNSLKERTGSSVEHVTPDWMIALTLQAVVCLATVLRVCGFMQEQQLL